MSEGELFDEKKGKEGRKGAVRMLRRGPMGVTIFLLLRRSLRTFPRSHKLVTYGPAGGAEGGSLLSIKFVRRFRINRDTPIRYYQHQCRTHCLCKSQPSTEISTSLRN